MASSAGTGNATVYGVKSWLSWCKCSPDNLRPTKQTPAEIWDAGPYNVGSFQELFRIVSFLNLMNKGDRLLFRGQVSDFPPRPTILRETWNVPGQNKSVKLSLDRAYYWTQLASLCDQVAEMLQGKLPRYRPFTNYKLREDLRVAPWAVIQHYELWPTPLLDLTSSLRVAASFALGLPKRRREGFVYVFAAPNIADDLFKMDKARDSLTFRLSAVCPPIAARPHLQEGYLTGNGHFQEEHLGQTQESPAADWLVAKLRLRDHHRFFVGSSQNFWTRDFPRHTANSLLPTAQSDDLLRLFRQRLGHRIKGGRAVIAELQTA